MPTYYVRRANSAAADLITVRGRDIFVNDRTISSLHCRVVQLNNGRYEVIDNDSTNGTFIRERSAWVRISTAELLVDDEVRLGLFETKVSDLISGESRATSPSAGPRFERDPESGQIVEKKRR